ALGTCRKAEERDQWVSRVHHHRRLPRYARANPKGQFRFAGLLGLRVEDRHFDARLMVVQRGHPGKFRLTAEVANNVEGAAFVGGAETVSQERCVLFRLALIFPDDSDPDDRPYGLWG